MFLCSAAGQIPGMRLLYSSRLWGSHCSAACLRDQRVLPHLGNNSKVDPNSHELLKPRTENPFPGGGRSTGFISSVLLVSPCPPLCPGSAQAGGMELLGDLTASSCLPSSQNLAGNREWPCLSCCSSRAGSLLQAGESTKSQFSIASRRESTKGRLQLFFGIWKRTDLCVFTFALLFVN